VKRPSGVKTRIPFGVSPNGKRLLPVRRRHFGDDEVPRADDLLAQALLRARVARKQRQRHQCNESRAHDALPVNSS
jgi:hypothetical protein